MSGDMASYHNTRLETGLGWTLKLGGLRGDLWEAQERSARVCRQLLHTIESGFHLIPKDDKIPVH